MAPVDHRVTILHAFCSIHYPRQLYPYFVRTQKSLVYTLSLTRSTFGL